MYPPAHPMSSTREPGRTLSKASEWGLVYENFET